MPDQSLLRGIKDPINTQHRITPIRDLYQMFNVGQPFIQDVNKISSVPAINMLAQDPLRRDIDPLQTSLDVVKPYLYDDGIKSYGYSDILNKGENEDRYAQGFRRDNPNKFYSGINPFKLLYRGAYWSGGFIEKTLESAVIKIGQGLSSLYGLSIGNTLKLLEGESFEGFSDWLAKSTDNVFSSIFDGWDQNLKDRYHYYQEKADRDKKGFVASLGDGDFWMNDLSDGLGFLLSSLIGAGLIGKFLGVGTKMASRLSPLAGRVSTQALMAENTAAGGIGANLQKAANLIGIEGSGNMLVKNAVDLTTQTLALTTIEAAVEAQEVKDSIYNSLFYKINPDTGLTYTEEEKNRLAAEGAAQTFRQNMSVLIGPKFIETLVFNRIGKALKGKLDADVQPGQASGRLASEGISKGISLQKASRLKTLWKAGSAAAIGFVSEGLWEENVQLAISREAEEQFAAGEYSRPSADKESIAERASGIFSPFFGDVQKRYLEQVNSFMLGVRDDRFIDDELSKSIGLGGLFGVFGGAIHGALGARQQAKIDKYWTDRINASTANLFESNNFLKTSIEDRPDPQNPGKTIPTTVVVTDPTTGQPIIDENKLKAYLNNMNNIQGIMDIISNTEDPNDESNKSYQAKELNKLARNVLFSNLAMEYVRAGKKDLLLQNLSSVSQFSDNDIQALGYEPGMMTPKERKDMLTKMTNLVNRLDKANDWIENNVLDNVSEPREGKFGLRYTKAQKQKRQKEFEAKKAYLRGLAMQNALLDVYLDEISESEIGLGEPVQEVLSSVLNDQGLPIQDFRAPVHLNSKIPALRNQIAILEREFAYHWDNMLSRERTAPKSQSFSIFAQTNNGKTLIYEQIKAQEALEKINELQQELEPLEAELKAILNNENFETFVEDGETFVRVKQQQPSTLDQIEADRIRRINNIKREEIAIQKRWIEREWQLTAALKEPKTAAERKDTYLSRRMTLSRNAYNTYFQREVMDKDNSLGQRKLKLYDPDPNKRVTTKKYVNNENKLLKSVRIQGKVQTILAEVNGQKLLAELNALLDRGLPSKEFAEELRKIIDAYNGKIMIISQSDKSLVDEQIQETEDEYNFVNGIFEYMPLDDRFNDKYYDIDTQGNYVVKEQYNDLFALGGVSVELRDRIDDLNKIKKFLESIPEEIPGDWNNPNVVRKRIADVYTETADSIINTYNQLSNNGQSEISGDSLSTKQDLDLIDQEIDELGQLKVIFEGRPDTLSTPEFQGFIDSIDKRIEDLKKIREIVKERLSSRLRENLDFLIDAVNNIVEQLGLNFDGSIKNQAIWNLLIRDLPPDSSSKLISSLEDLKVTIDKEDKDADDKKKINDSYWNINGQVAAILEILKSKDRRDINAEIQSQKKTQITNLEATALMQKLKGESYYRDIIDNIDDSLLGALQLIFFQSQFSRIGVAGDTNQSFLDDQPSSPVYKFREDYNLRKFIRNIEKDNSRTPDNTEISKEDLTEFLQVAKNIQDLEDLENNLNTTLNILDQVEREKEVVQAKIDKKDNKYENLIVPSIQQLFFIRKIASFLRSNKVQGEPGFRNWIYIQAPGGAGKTQTLGTWFNVISGIPRDRVLATAFTEEASKSINKALLIEENPRDASEMVATIREYTRDKQFDFEVLIIDEFPAIDVGLQKELFDAVSEYTKEKRKAGKGEFKVITMGDTNQLTFSENGSVTPRPSIIVNPGQFGKGNHPAKMTIIPSLTVNFRSNLFAITSFIDQFKGSAKDNVNATLKVASTDPLLDTENVKGVVSVSKADFQTKLINYLRKNINSIRTKALIVNETKLDQYKKLLTDNGIKVITDPNDEVTKGVYVTTVKNVQGFSFDEVFVDIENNDKTLFSGTSSPNFIYNKAMYVAASRARNLIVVTNFPNFENVEDQSISALENKALDELQTKDSDFIAQRDLEINGAKHIMGSEYSRSVVSATPVQAEEKVETVLDQEEDKPEEEEITEPEEEQEEQEKPAETPEEEQPEEPEQTQEGVDQSKGNEVIPTSGLEDNQQETDVVDSSEKAEEAEKSMWEKVKDSTISAYNKVRSDITELLFPTGQTVKYKIGEGEFSVRPGEEYENQNLRSGDRVIVIPFQQSKTSNSPRKFGYAVITPAIDSDGKVIPNSYRTVAVLSDYEIDQLKERPETTDLYNAIVENERRDKGFVSIEYLADIADENGFITSASKIINPLQEGVVIHAQSVKYFYGRDNVTVNRQVVEDMIDHFIDQFYDNHIKSFPVAQQQAERNKIRDFYRNSRNAQIIIPTRKDVDPRKPNLNIPPELRGYVRAGRPYLMFRPFHRRSTMQFIALSRKFLDTTQHGDTLNPIRDFINSAKAVKRMLAQKGITNKMGYSRTMSTLLSKVANIYVRDNTQNTYSVSITTTVNGRRVTETVKFSNTEAERIYNLYAMYSEPNTQYIKAETDKEIQNLTNVRRARNYVFDDGTVVYGTIDSYDPNTKTFTVRDLREKDEQGNYLVYTKSGAIHHYAKSFIGKAQQALDDIMNSNGHIASRFVSTRGRIGFVTGREQTGISTQDRNYKFMALLGSKSAPVPKSYNNDGTVREYYDDVIEILEDLFNFAVRGVMPLKEMNYLDTDGSIGTVGVQFRVPVPLNARNESTGELEFDYTFSPTNTSRDITVPNSRFFESNFETMIPTRVFVKFGISPQVEEAEEAQRIEELSVEEETRQPDIEPEIDVRELTKEDIQTLSLDDLINRFTPEQRNRLEVYAQANGWAGYDHFISDMRSAHPEEQEIFRDYVIECLL